MDSKLTGVYCQKGMSILSHSSKVTYSVENDMHFE